MLSVLIVGETGTSGGRVSEGSESGLPGLGIKGRDGGGIKDSRDAGAALGLAGTIESGRVSVGVVLLGLVSGNSSIGSAGAGTGVADGTGLLMESLFESLVVVLLSFSFGSVNGGRLPGLVTIGGFPGSVAWGASGFLGGVTGETTDSFFTAG